MDFSESTKVVYERIQEFEPDSVSKIIGYLLLLQDHGEKEMIRLAFGPDKEILSLINKAKSHLMSLSSSSNLINPSVTTNTTTTSSSITTTTTSASPVSLISSSPKLIPSASGNVSPMHLSTSAFSPEHSSLDNSFTHYSGHYYPASFPNGCQLHNQLHFLSSSSKNQVDNLVTNNNNGSSYYSSSEPKVCSRANRRSPSMPEFPVKVCHYFNRGFCKHGSNCRYFHGGLDQSFSHMMFTSSSDHECTFANNNDDDHFFPPAASLEKLEMELTQLLKSRRGFPVSIASLPMMYQDKFGKTLQAEGYLTESQRHGKAGYSLTKLLARLKNTICLIDRPHGQHSVILTEDIPIYMDRNGERNDYGGGIVAGSRQIYLTFPAESTFSEQDVSNYFRKFGPVQDVRIPCQQKRMFGFVTFVFTETVKQILAKGNPHFVCGSRVLVKPYREKARVLGRKYAERFQHSMYHGSSCVEAESQLQSSGILTLKQGEVPRICDNNSTLLKKQLLEQQALEFERMRLSEMQLAAKPLNQVPYYSHTLDEFKLPEGHSEQMDFTSAEPFSYLLDVLNNGSPVEERVGHINTKYHEPDSSQGLNLPDSPFASPLGSGISAVI